jgi:hypothetical protein
MSFLLFKITSVISNRFDYFRRPPYYPNKYFLISYVGGLKNEKKDCKGNRIDASINDDR